MRIVTDIFAWCRDHLPKWNTISIPAITSVKPAPLHPGSRLHSRRCIAYVQAALDAGLRVDEFAPQKLSFFFNAHSDLLEEIAKYRAARRLWAKSGPSASAQKIPLPDAAFSRAKPPGSSLPRSNRKNNIVRVAIQALAAVLAVANPAHQFHGRSARVAHGRRRPHRSAHPASPRP